MPGCPTYRWKVNIEVDAKKMECDIEDWIHMPQGKEHTGVLVYTHMARNFFISYPTVTCFTRMDLDQRGEVPAVTN
jgi:hypothetical protein